ncbi:C6 transcription factor, partial [Colletotrichum musicola]
MGFNLMCDLHPGTCGQCRRARLTCHGYRDPDALQFRDESQSVERKNIARRCRYAYPGSHPTTLELGWDARARYAFFSTYIGGFTRSMGDVAHHYRTAGAFDHLSASVEAASLAFMATQLGSPHLMHLASASYLTAIQRLSRGLPDLTSDRAEEALQSVLLLDMYEKMAHRDPRTSQSWISHARGGLSILSTQTASIISSQTGCHLAARLVTAVTVSCATIGAGTPRELNLLRRNIGYRVRSPKWSFLGVLGRVSNLQLDMEKGAVSRS